MIPKIIATIKTHQNAIFLVFLMGLISFISFNLGKISSNQKGELRITTGANIYRAAQSDKNTITNKPTPKLTPRPLDLRVVASKASDSKKYHFTWCAGAKQIKEENKVWFNSAEEAIASGFTLAGNCK